MIFFTGTYTDVWDRSHRSRIFRAAAFGSPAAFMLAIWVAFFVLGCAAEPRGVPCPAGYVADDARGKGLLEALGAAQRGAGLVEKARSRRRFSICFGSPGVSVVTDEGALLIDEGLGEKEAAARVGHLLEHVAMGSPLSLREGETCEQAVARALSIEAEALSFELDLRRDLSVASPRVRYEFEEDYWKANESDRHRLVLEYLRAHPRGGPGVDALALGYEQRCREGKP